MFKKPTTWVPYTLHTVIVIVCCYYSIIILIVLDLVFFMASWVLSSISDGGTGDGATERHFNHR